MNVSLFRAQSQALNSTVLLFPSCFIRLYEPYYGLQQRETSSSLLSLDYALATPLRAQEPIRSQWSVCRQESTFDPPLNYDENLQKPKKGSRRERTNVSLSIYYDLSGWRPTCARRVVLYWFAILQVPSYRLRRRRLTQPFRDDNYLTIRLLSSSASDNDDWALTKRSITRNDSRRNNDWW